MDLSRKDTQLQPVEVRMTEVDQSVDSCLPYESTTSGVTLPHGQPEQLSIETAVNYNLCKTPEDSPNLNSRKTKTTTQGSPHSSRRELPPNWERIKSVKHKRFYYWNKTTDKTTWTFPVEEGKVICSYILQTSFGFGFCVPRVHGKNT